MTKLSVCSLQWTALCWSLSRPNLTTFENFNPNIGKKKWKHFEKIRPENRHFNTNYGAYCVASRYIYATFMITCSSCCIARPSSNIARPSCYIACSSCCIARLSSDIARPLSDVARPSSDIARPPCYIACPSCCIARLSSGIARPLSDVT
jgi:hypothetical protein